MLQKTEYLIPASFFTIGLAYISIFVPYVWYSSINTGLDPLRVLLFVELPEFVRQDLVEGRLPSLDEPSAYPFVFSLLVFYGYIAFTAGIIFLSSANNLLRNFTAIADAIIGANAFYFALPITYAIAEFFLELAPVVEQTYATSYFVFAQIVVTYTLFQFLRLLLPGQNYFAKEYSFVFDALFGLFVTQIFVSTFGLGISSLMTGPIFVIIAFLIMMPLEYYIFRPIFVFLFSLISLDNEELDTGKVGKANVVRTLKKAWQVSKERFGSENPYALTGQIAEEIGSVEKEASFSLREDVSFFFFLTALNGLFPPAAFAAFFAIVNFLL